MKKLKTKVVQKGLIDFFKILDLSSSNTREKYLLKIKCLHFFSLQATAVDRCEPPLKMPPLTISWYRSLSHASYASDNKIMQTGKNISKLASKIGTTVIAPLSKNTLQKAHL